MKRKITIGYVLSRLMLVFLAVVGVFPFIMTLYLSVRNNIEIATEFWSLPRVLHWDNYAAAFQGICMPVARSIMICIVTITLLLMLSSFTAYIFARMEFKGKEFIFTLYMIVMMIPGTLTMAPLFFMVNRLGLLDSWWAIILPHVAFWQILGINILRNNYAGIPNSLFESAKLEGANDIFCFLQIALPLTVPALLTVGIQAFLAFYNEYIWSSLVLSGSKKLFSMFVVELGSGNSSDMGITSAAYVLGTIPLLILMSFGMKYYLQGALSGSVKE